MVARDCIYVRKYDTPAELQSERPLGMTPVRATNELCVVPVAQVVQRVLLVPLWGGDGVPDNVSLGSVSSVFLVNDLFAPHPVLRVLEDGLCVSPAP